MPLLPTELSTKKMIRILKYKYTLFYACIVALFQVSSVLAFENNQFFDLAELGDFEVKFSTVKKAEFIVGQNLIGTVSYKSGENYSIALPFDVQQIIYHVQNGNYVNQGDTIATVEGYDVHHFIDEFTSAEQLLKISGNHFQTNKKYFENKTLKSSQWIEITKNYFDAKLKFEHFQHQMSFLHVDKSEKITLVSPKKGIVKIPDLQNIKAEGDLAFDVINTESIKIKITTPLSYITKLSHFVISPSCELEINSIENIANKFHQILWASPKSNHCNLTLGQAVKVTPLLSFDGYTVPKTSVFEFNNKNTIAIKSENGVSLIIIKIIGSNNHDYYVETKGDISNKKILASSVSILQGKLLALGAE